MSLIEEALRKAKKEGKHSPEELAYEINPNNILNLSYPKKNHRLLLGISIVSVLFILVVGFIFFFWGAEKLTCMTPPKLLASNNLAPNLTSTTARAIAVAPQKAENQESSSPASEPVAEKKIPVTFKNLVADFNGKTLTLHEGEHLKVKRGDLITLKEVTIEGALPKDVKVNFLGFVGNPSDNTGDARGYTINTASDLREKYSFNGKGATYPITIEKEGNQIGTIYVDIEETKTVLVQQNQVPKLNKPSPSPKEIINIESLLTKAFVYNQAGNYASALECYNKILSANPHLFEALLNRGIIREKLENLQGAEQDLLKAHETNPHDPVLLNALGVFYLRTGDEEKAEEFLLKANSTTSMINLAFYYWKKGEKEEKVVSILNQAEKQDCNDPYPAYYLGLFYRQIGKNALAREKLDKALSLAQKRGLFDLIHQIDSIIPGL